MKMPQERLVKELKNRRMTVTTVESCTGGMVAAAITSVAGSSEVLKQALVTYCDSAKHELAGVKSETLEKYTAVSAQTVREMAQGGALIAKANCCLSVTGYAGPDSGGGETVGLVYIGCFVDGETVVEEHRFDGGRREVREQAAQRALELLLERLGAED